MSNEQIDREVHSKVFGKCLHLHLSRHKALTFAPHGIVTVVCDDCNQKPDLVPNYSTDIAAAWKVIEWMVEKKRLVGIYPIKEVWNVQIINNDRTFPTDCIEGSSAPLAICKAALRIIELEKESNDK